MKKSFIGGLEIVSFYENKEKVTSLVRQLIACADIELACVFLHSQRAILPLLFPRAVFTFLPALDGKDEERGFSPNEEMLRFGSKKFLCLFRYEEGRIKLAKKHGESSFFGKTVVVFDGCGLPLSNYMTARKSLLQAGAKRVVFLTLLAPGEIP